MASFVEGACTAVHTALTDDATLVALVGDTGQIRRANQKGETEPPCVIIEPTGHNLIIEAADELREVGLALHCYAAKDFDTTEIFEAVVELLHYSISLSATGFKIDMAFFRGDFGAPIWSPPEQAFRCDAWLYLNMKSTT